MALSTKQIGSAASSSVAAATVRIGAGGRNVASSSRADVEKLDFSPQLGVNEEQILRFQQDSGELNPDGKRNSSRDSRDGFTPLVARGAVGLDLENSEESDTATGSKLFLTDILHGIDSYEESMRITSPNAVKPGSVMNYLF